MIDLTGRTLAAGVGRGEALTLQEPLSFWGGFDGVTGTVSDTHHPQQGVCLSGRVVFMRRGRGSSSSPSVLAEAIHVGTAPAAIVLTEIDAMIALGALVAAELYGVEMPVVVLAPGSTSEIEDGVPVTVDATKVVAVVEADPRGTRR
ncbi:MAG TPA: DUF126 domain-containing protein [Actinomycetota bacterium]